MAFTASAFSYNNMLLSQWLSWVILKIAQNWFPSTLCFSCTENACSILCLGTCIQIRILNPTSIKGTLSVPTRETCHVPIEGHCFKQCRHIRGVQLALTGNLSQTSVDTERVGILIRSMNLWLEALDPAVLGALTLYLIHSDGLGICQGGKKAWVSKGS